MTIPKKGSRKIVVEGIEYRWKVHWRHSIMTSSVELYEEPKSVLSISFLWIPKKDFWDWYEVPAIIIPQIIETCIKKAISQGWKPNEKGQTFKITHEKE